jgi:hypothetical protein
MSCAITEIVVVEYIYDTFYACAHLTKFVGRGIIYDINKRYLIPFDCVDAIE